jgi:protein-S-isoprenylcysteine O-methyltransferase Ste14
VTASISRSERRLLVAVIVLAAVLRFIRLGAQSLWVDEILTLIVATPKPGFPLGQLLLHNIHGPVHTFVVALMRQISENDAWLRLPSAVAGVISVPLLFLWVRPRFGSRVALWSAFLLAVNPLHLHYSQELRNYAFAVCFVLASCVLLDGLCARWSVARAAAFAVSVAAAVLCNFSACFAFVVQAAVFVKSSAARGRALARWVLITAMVVLMTSPWIYRVTTYVDFGKLATPVEPGALATSQRLRGDTTFRWEAIPYTFFAYSAGFALGPTLAEMHGDLGAALAHHRAAIAWTALLFGSLGVAGLYALCAPPKGSAWRGTEVMLYILVPLVATLLLNWQNAKAFNVRYVLIGLPMYLAVLAAGIYRLRREPRVLAMIFVLTTTAIALFNYYTDPSRQKEDVRDATRAVETAIKPGECIFAPTVWQIVAHYQKTPAPLHYVYREPAGMTERGLQDLYSSCPSFWYLRARPWVDDPDGSVLAAIEARYHAVEEMNFPGVRVIHFSSGN